MYSVLLDILQSIESALPLYLPRLQELNRIQSYRRNRLPALIYKVVVWAESSLL